MVEGRRNYRRSIVQKDRNQYIPPLRIAPVSFPLSKNGEGKG